MNKLLKLFVSYIYSFILCETINQWALRHRLLLACSHAPLGITSYTWAKVDWGDRERHKSEFRTPDWENILI